LIPPELLDLLSLKVVSLEIDLKQSIGFINEAQTKKNKLLSYVTSMFVKPKEIVGINDFYKSILNLEHLRYLKCMLYNLVKLLKLEL
jgi:hypothetical protein